MAETIHNEVNLAQPPVEDDQLSEDDDHSALEWMPAGAESSSRSSNGGYYELSMYPDSKQISCFDDETISIFVGSRSCLDDSDYETSIDDNTSIVIPESYRKQLVSFLRSVADMLERKLDTKPISTKIT